MSQPRTVPQAIDDLTKISNWMDGPFAARIENRTHIHRSPTTSEARLPFGLDATLEDLDQGPDGIRTPQGAQKHLEHLAYWLHSSDKPGNLPNYDHPIAWMIFMLQMPYKWEEWGTPLAPGCEWEAWTEDVQQTRKVIGRLTGNNPTPAGTCPRCGGTLLSRPGTHGEDSQVICAECRVRGNAQVRSIAYRQELQQVDTDMWVTGKEALQIWPELDRRRLHDWRTRGQIKTRGTGPARQYPLQEVNTLAARLLQRADAP